MAAETKTDKTVALLQLLGQLGGSGAIGLYIVTIRTADPDPVTFVMQGTPKALGPDIFEIPAACYPLREGDRLLAFPIIGGQRWGVLEKINGGVVMATWDGSKVQPDGMTAAYSADVPDNLTLQAGDRVAIAPLWDGSQISYIVMNKY